jgi:hypothetical protein
VVREIRHDSSTIDEVFLGGNAERELVIESAHASAGNAMPSWQV